jgi:hypothetical protein
MKMTIEAYDVEGTLLPKAEYEVVSSFTVQSKEQPDLVLGLWVQKEGNQVTPIYITEAQRKTAVLAATQIIVSLTDAQ